jgi:hypothetical protein
MAGISDAIDEFSSGLGRRYEAEAERIEDQVQRIKLLKRSGAYEEALRFLVAELDLQERDAASISGWGVAPWYYEQAAIVYRKMKLYEKECEVLERYFRQPHAPGVGPDRLAERLNKVWERNRKMGLIP